MDAAQIYQTLVGAGFTGQNAVIATAIALAESGGNPGATHSNDNGSIDRGLMQVNSVHSQYNSGQLLDPAYNAKAAFQIAGGGTNFGPWSTYNSGAYKKYLAEAQAAAGGGGLGAGAVDSQLQAQGQQKQVQSLASQIQQASDTAAGTPPPPITEAPTTTPTTQPQTTQPASTETSSPESGAAGTAIKTALGAVGTKYVWGGNSLTQGVDCSGLVQQAYKAAGINIPRVSDQIINHGTPVDPSQMQPGDILGWTYDNSLGGGATHVAMYIGGGKMIEALNSHTPVHVVDVRNPQYVVRYAQSASGPAQLFNDHTAQPKNDPNSSLQARLAAVAAAFSSVMNPGSARTMAPTGGSRAF